MAVWQYLVWDAVPAVVERAGLVLRREGHHHQVVAGPGCVQQDHHGSDGRRLAHRRTLQREGAESVCLLRARFGLPGWELSVQYR